MPTSLLPLRPFWAPTVVLGLLAGAVAVPAQPPEPAAEGKAVGL